MIQISVLVYILLLSIGLAMDAFSVCVSYGICQKEGKFTSALRLAFFTGLFQFLMPLLGWFGGNLVGRFFTKYSSWIAFIILLILGIKMIIDSILKKEDKECKPVDISKGKHLIIICIATSIDAFAAGLSLGILKIPLLISTAMIGIITFLISLAGVYVGKLVGFIAEKWAEIIGGLILIGLGFKILLF